jgi:hypothetical protein
MPYPGKLPGRMARDDDPRLEREACQALASAPEETQRLRVLIKVVYDAGRRSWVIESFRGANRPPPEKLHWWRGMDAFEGLHVRPPQR